MKNSKVYAGKFASLIARLRAEFDIPSPAKLDPMAQFISGFLMWEASSVRADTAFERIQDAIVDYNDLRVFLPEEIVRLIGERYPLSRERAQRMRDSLRDLFDREHEMSLSRVMAMPNRDARVYLDDLAGMPPYVSAQVILFSKRGHAIPVDDQLRRRLVEDDVINPEADIPTVQAWLERQVKAADAVDVHLLLQGYVEDQPPRGTRRSTGGKRAASAKSSKPKSGGRKSATDSSDPDRERQSA